MLTMEEIVKLLKKRFGVLAESNTYQLTVVATNADVAIGDLFLLPCRRGGERFYIFRTTEYANILNRTLEIGDVARNKLTMPDSYFAKDLKDEKLIQLKGIILGYAERQKDAENWDFKRPRRLPQHLSDVYHVVHNNENISQILRSLMRSQLGTEGIYIGELLAGEHAVANVPVYLPAFAFSHHIGIFGRTGCGKSNLMMMILCSIMEHNRTAISDQKQVPISIFAIDPHDEFRSWHANSGGADGVHGIVESYSPEQKKQLVEPFYYLSARNIGSRGLERKVYLSRADVVPDDLISIMEFSEQQIAFAHQFYSHHGERWVGQLLLGDTEIDEEGETGGQFLPGTISAVQRRLGFLRQGHNRIFTKFDPDLGEEYQYRSILPDIVCALEKGRVLIIDSTLMTEMEQFLLNTIVARVLFSLRKALRSSEDASALRQEIREALGNDEDQGQIGMRSFAEEMVRRLDAGDLPYLDQERVISPDKLPYINVVIEEAPSILNPQRMRFGSIFRDISRQGRKFGIGLTVISQQVSEIDKGVLTQINTELNMALGNEMERKEAVRNGSADLYGFERELQVLGKGQVIISASYKDVPLPVQVSDFDLCCED